MTAYDRAWVLIARAISGEISIAEQQELDQRLASDPELNAIYHDLTAMQLHETAELTSAGRKAMERGLDKLDESLTGERRFIERYIFDHSRLSPISKNRYGKWLAVSGIAAMLLCGIYILKPTPQKEKPVQVIATNYGKRVQATLPDGSVVFINAGSKLSYTMNAKREVYLSGEAYFDVKHDSAHPFIVHAGSLGIVVLGTAFDVKAYKDDKYIETTLIRGKVSVINEARPGKPIVLLPNEKLTVGTENMLVKKLTVSAKQQTVDSMAVAPAVNAQLQLPDSGITETGWVNNRLTFKKETFDDLARQLERWYNVKIVFDNDRYSDKKLTGTFTGQGIDDVMRALQYTQPFHYAMNENHEIHIW